ncbi:hypothetical protein FJR04_24325 [Anabaena sp. UHCC 0204]|nr:hypothetical protein [Anabaena sp. UHCC 0204]
MSNRIETCAQAVTLTISRFEKFQEVKRLPPPTAEEYYADSPYNYRTASDVESQKDSKRNKALRLLNFRDFNWYSFIPSDY